MAVLRMSPPQLVCVYTVYTLHTQHRLINMRTFGDRCGSLDNVDRHGDIQRWAR